MLELMMRKPYTSVCFLSYISYIAVYFAMPYGLAFDWTLKWSNWASYFFALSVLYQITYLFYFRKRDNVSFGRALAYYVLGLSILGDMLVLYTYAKAFFNGYVFSFFTFYSRRYYGFEAWKNMVYESIILLPLLTLSTVYQIIFFMIRRRAKKL